MTSPEFSAAGDLQVPVQAGRPETEALQGFIPGQGMGNSAVVLAESAPAVAEVRDIPVEMAPALESLATAKHGAELAARGIRGYNTGKLSAVSEAAAEVKRLVDEMDFGSVAEKLLFKAAIWDRVSEIQVATSENAKVPRWATMLQKVCGNRVLQVIARHRTAFNLAVAGTGLVAGTVVSVLTGGAAIPVVAKAAGFAMVKAGITGPTAAAFMATLGDRARRLVRNNDADYVRGRNDQQRAGLERLDTESDEDYEQRLDNAVHHNAAAIHGQNTSDRNRTVGRAMGRALFSSTALAGGFSALSAGFHAMDIGVALGHHMPAAPSSLTPEQVQQLVLQHANQIPGLEHLDSAHAADLSNQAAQIHGHTLYYDVQHHNGAPGTEVLSDSATLENTLRGMATLHDHGFQVKAFGDIHWDPNAHQYVTTGDHWGFGDDGAVQTPGGEAVHIVFKDAQGHLVERTFQGTLNDGQQSAVIDLLRYHGGQVMSQAEYNNFILHAATPADINSLLHQYAAATPPEVPVGVVSQAHNAFVHAAASTFGLLDHPLEVGVVAGALAVPTARNRPPRVGQQRSAPKHRRGRNQHDPNRSPGHNPDELTVTPTESADPLAPTAAELTAASQEIVEAVTGLMQGLPEDAVDARRERVWSVVARNMVAVLRLDTYMDAALQARLAETSGLNREEIKAMLRGNAPGRVLVDA